MLNLKKLFRRKYRAPALPEINIDKKGFFFTIKSGEEIRVDWGSISEIRSWKNDLFAVDEVMFGYRVSTTNVIEISEEQVGFDKVIEETERRFKSVQGWESKIIQPPFQTNETVLYEST